MHRWGIVIAAVVIALLAASQVLVPSLAARKVENRLTEGGGGADVTLGAVPAVRLLWGDGERFEVEAHDLDLDLDEDLGVFDRLDGFWLVDVSITSFEAGPFGLDTFELSRDGDGPYSLVSSGQAQAADLAGFGASSLGIPGGPLASIALDLFGGEDIAMPIDLDLELDSRTGGSRSPAATRRRRLPGRAARRAHHVRDRRPAVREARHVLCFACGRARRRTDAFGARIRGSGSGRPSS